MKITIKYSDAVMFLWAQTCGGWKEDGWQNKTHCMCLFLWCIVQKQSTCCFKHFMLLSSNSSTFTIKVCSNDMKRLHQFVTHNKIKIWIVYFNTLIHIQTNVLNQWIRNEISVTVIFTELSCVEWLIDDCFTRLIKIRLNQLSLRKPLSVNEYPVQQSTRQSLPAKKHSSRRTGIVLSRNRSIGVAPGNDKCLKTKKDLNNCLVERSEIRVYLLLSSPHYMPQDVDIGEETKEKVCCICNSFKNNPHSPCGLFVTWQQWSHGCVIEGAEVSFLLKINTYWTCWKYSWCECMTNNFKVIL